MKCSIKKLVSDAARLYDNEDFAASASRTEFRKHARFLLSGYEDWCTELFAHDVFMVALFTLDMLHAGSRADHQQVVSNSAQKLRKQYVAAIRCAAPHVHELHVEGIVNRVLDDLRTAAARSGFTLYEMVLIGRCMVLAVLRAKAV